MSDAFQGLKADYAAMTDSRFRRRRNGIAPTGSGADYHYRNETQFLKMREYVRAMDRDDALIGCSIDKVVQQHIQGGFRCDPQTGDRKLDADLYARWDSWATDADQCDVAGELEFAEMEALALRHQLVDGDVFGLPTAGGALQMVEADQCRTPTNSRRNIVLGVELDAQRRRQSYFFAKRHIDPFHAFERVGDADEIPARDQDGERLVFHVFNPNRVSQTRGVTAFHAVFDIAGMFEDTNFALLVKQQIAACFGIFLERTDAYGSEMRLGERTDEALGDGNSATVEGITPGMVIRGRKGEKVSAFSAQIPSAETMAHIKLLIQIIAVNLGIPAQLLMLDASETNFSGWRGAMDMAKLGFKVNQRSLIRRWNRRVYRWKALQWCDEDAAIASARRRLGDDAFFRHAWHRPAWPYIQPKDDAEANVLRVTNFQASPRQIAAENGLEFEELADETIRDNVYVIGRAIRGAQRIKQRHGVDVDWREVLRPFGTGKAAGEGKDGAAGAKGAAGGDGTAADPFERVKQQADAFGVVVRAGGATPQKPDEAHFRALLQMPAMGPDADRAWTEDEGFRRPITLAVKGATPPGPGAAPSPADGEDAEDDE